jgi:hypothetical protein
MGIEEPTPPYGRHARPPTGEADALTRVDRRTRDTADTSRATLDRVGLLAREVRDHLGKQDDRIAELSEHMAGVDGKLDILLEVIAEQRRESGAIRVAAAQAAIRVESTDRISKIREGRDERRWRRSIIFKVSAGALGLAALVLEIVAAGRC